MDATIIISTYNRFQELEQTLGSFTRPENPVGSQWELIVVDNNSNDETKSICDSFLDRLPLRYSFEAKQGKAIALNHAVDLAKGSLLLFTDDDVTLPPSWIANYIRASKQYPDAQFFGGKVISSWQQQPAQWFVENAEWLRCNPRVDLGDKPIRITQPDTHTLIGANIAYRKSVFDQGPRFREDLGCVKRIGHKDSRHCDEHFFIVEKLLKQGRHGMYLPDSHVHHRDPPERMTEKYIRYFYTQNRIEQVLRGKIPDSPHQWFGAPRHLWRKLIVNIFKYACTRPFGSSQTWLRAEVDAAAAWGDIRGFRRLRREPINPPEKAP